MKILVVFPSIFLSLSLLETTARHYIRLFTSRNKLQVGCNTVVVAGV